MELKINQIHCCNCLDGIKSIGYMGGGVKKYKHNYL